MKLRIDLLEYLIPADVMENVGFDIHRFSSEPIFAKTGVGYLKSATIADKIAEAGHYDRMMEKIMARAASDLAARQLTLLDSSQQ